MSRDAHNSTIEKSVGNLGLGLLSRVGVHTAVSTYDRPPQDLEIMMATTITMPALAARKTTVSSVPSDPLLDPLDGNIRRVVQAKEASQTTKKDVRKRYVDPTICEGDYAAAELEFMHAMNEYKQSSRRMFPTWSEVLEVLCDLGYKKATVEGAVQGTPTKAAQIGTGPHFNSEPLRRRVTRPAV
jgi:hypothetical protein